MRRHGREPRFQIAELLEALEQRRHVDAHQLLDDGLDIEGEARERDAAAVDFDHLPQPHLTRGTARLEVTVAAEIERTAVRPADA